MSRPLGLILLLYAVTASAWVLLNPVFEAPDEPFHVANVNLLLRVHRWPQESDVAATESFLQAHTLPAQYAQIFEEGQWRIFLQWAQPPLYYVLQTIPLSLVYPHGYSGVLLPLSAGYFQGHLEGGFFQHGRTEWRSWSRPLLAVRLMRFCSVLLGGFVIYCTARIASLVAPRSASLPVVAAGLHAFIPMFTFMSATVNNDVLSYAMNAAALWVMLGVIKDRWPVPRAILSVGGILGIGLLSKLTCMFLILLIPVVSAVAYDRWSERLLCAAGSIVAGLLLGTLGMIGRASAFLDLFGYALFGRPSAWLTFSTPFLGDPTAMSWGYVGKVLQMLGESFWGQFGWFQVPIDPTILVIYWGVVVLAALGWLRSGGSVRRLSCEGRLVAVLAAVVLIFFGCTAHAYLHTYYVPQGGRHLLNVAPAITILLAIGLLHMRTPITKMVSRPLTEGQWTWALVVLFVCLNGLVLWRSIFLHYLGAWAALDRV